MKLSVSNIAWDNKRLEEHLELLSDLGCDGVEIAPSKIWKEPVDASREAIEDFRKLIDKHDLEISAFHALLFTRPDLHLFKDRDSRNRTIGYIKLMIKLACDLSVKVLVYGSPKSRSIDDRSYEESYKVAVDVFLELAQEAASYDTCFCIEPLGHSYTDFINTSDEGYRLVQDVNSPNFGLHLDIRAMLEAGEDFGEVFNKYSSIARHIHVGGPDLAPPGYVGLDHTSIGEALFKSSYNGFVSIEMRQGFGDSKEVVKKAVEYVRKKYHIA